MSQVPALPAGETPGTAVRHGFVRLGEHATCRAVLRDPSFQPIDLAGYLRTLQEQSGCDLRVLEHLARNIPFFLSGTRHLKLHNLASGFFGANRIRPWQGCVESIVDSTLDALARVERPDLMGDFVEPLFQTAMVAVLGMHPGDAPKLTEWSRETRRLLEPMQSLRSMTRLQATIEAILLHLDRTEPVYTAGCPAPFLAQVMERLSEDFDRADAIALTATLLVAGQTTSQTLGNILLHLLQAPAAARAQAADPAWVARHLETLLRLHASPQFIDRVATEDRRIGGCPFRAGDHVHMHLPSINRDPDVFPRDEDGEASVAHLSFGTGIHKCPGAAYGRMVIRTALPRLFARYPQLRLDVDQPQWLETTFVRAPVSLPCTLHP